VPALGPEESETPERLWALPEGVSVFGPSPGALRRQRAADVWSRLRRARSGDRTLFTWGALSRMQLLGSALAPLLAALGKDLWHLLEQPARGSGFAPRRAA